MGTYPLVEGNTIYPNLPMNHKVFLAQFEAIKEIAKKGPCVIVEDAQIMYSKSIRT